MHNHSSRAFPHACDILSCIWHTSSHPQPLTRVLPLLPSTRISTQKPFCCLSNSNITNAFLPPSLPPLPPSPFQKRCNRRNPCQICTSRGIKCVPQIRGPGRPPGSKSSRGSLSSSSLALSSSRHGGSRGDVRSALNNTQHSTSSSATTSAASSTASSLSRSLSGNGLLQQEQELAAAAAAQRSPPRDPWHCRFFFEAARHCKEALLKAWHDNELDTSKCIMLRYVFVVVVVVIISV